MRISYQGTKVSDKQTNKKYNFEEMFLLNYHCQFHIINTSEHVNKFIIIYGN